MSVRDILTGARCKWMEGTGPENDVVISSRIRLARNLNKYPFPHFMSAEDAARLVAEVKEAIGGEGMVKQFGGLEFIELSGLTQVERQVLVEKHMVSPQHAEATDNRAVVLAPDASVSIMINEEDHLRIQFLLPGLQIEETWRQANLADDLLEAVMDFSFCEKRGYLTSCPTNVGTGLRASVMMHLPCLVMSNQMGKVIAAISQLGLAVRGYYGEGTEAFGNLFQVSNQVSMGQTEEEIVKNLLTVTNQIVAQERTTRETIFENSKTVLEDRIYRAFGNMSYARMMTSQEALKNISDLRLGVELGILKNLTYEQINELIIITRPAFLVKKAGQSLDPKERDALRAETIREKLAEIEI